MQRRASACLIDVYQTLLTCDFAACQGELRNAVGVSLEEWTEGVDRFSDAVTHGRISLTDVFCHLIAVSGRRPTAQAVRDLVQMDRELLVEHSRLYEDTVPFLEMLRRRSVASVLVSNCADNTGSLLEALGVGDLVDGAVLSCEVGSAKPAPAIFRAALRSAGCEAGHALFIDDQAAYCHGAESIGIPAVQIARGGAQGRSSDRQIVLSLVEIDLTR